MAQTKDVRQTPKGAWGIVALLFLYMVVNFADKAIVGLAKVPIATDLKLTPEQFGFLGSAFFFLFSASAIVVGFIVNKVPTRWVILVMAIIWAIAQFPMMMDVSFTTLVICRILLGAGEGPAFSVAIHAIYKWFPDEKRGLPTALLSQGSAFGVILALPILNWIVTTYNWHHAFGTLGFVGLAWAVAWFIFGKEGPLEDAPAVRDASPKIPYSRLLTCPTFIGCCLATFGAYWALSLGLTWFPAFVVEGLGFAQKDAGLIATLPWLFGACVVLLTGYVSQRLMARGVSTRIARGVLGAAPLVLGGLVLVAMPYLPSGGTSIALLVFGSGLAGSIYVMCPPMISEFTPTSQRGAVIAIYGAIYTLAGVVAPFVMGKVIQNAATPTQGYFAGFVLNGTILAVSGLAGLALLWPASERARLARSEPRPRPA